MGVHNTTVNNPVKFSDLVTTVCHLVRCKYTPQMIDLPDDQLPDTFITFKDHRNFTTYDKDAPFSKLNERILLTQDEIDIVINCNFFNGVCYDDYSCENYGKALAHLCFNNKKLSKLICIRLTEGIRNCKNYFASKSFLQVMEHFVT